MDSQDKKSILYNFSNRIKQSIDMKFKIDDKSILLGNRLTLILYGKIDDFYNSIYGLYPQGISYIHDLWDAYTNYIIKKCRYGYHFKNIPVLNTCICNDPNVNIDTFVDSYAKEFNYNICQASDIRRAYVDNNILYIELLTEAYLPGVDVDNNISEKVSLDENHAENFDKNMQKVQIELDDIDFFNMLPITIKPSISENVSETNIKVKFAITKISFLNVYRRYRHTEKTDDEIWNSFCNDFSMNIEKYKAFVDNNLDTFDYFNREFSADLNNMKQNIYDISITNNNKVIRFWKDFSRR